MKPRRQFLGQLAAALPAAAFTRSFAAEPFPKLPETIRFAILGLEGHYSEVTNAARSLSNLRVTAISDPRPEILRRGFPGAARHSDPVTLLDREQFEIACVCGQNGTRAKLLQACAERRLPILSEKPLALTLSDLAAVKAAVEKHHVPLSMLLTMRGSPPYLAMREIVRGGEIGEVVTMDAQKSYKLG